MRFPRLIFFTGLFLFFCSLVNSQTIGYKVETFGTRNGLLSSKIFAIAQSADRMLWIGTELGVSRYDGYSFSNYQYTNENAYIGRILCITQDSAKGTWFGGDNGLFYFSGDSLQKITFSNRSSIAVEALLTDAEGNIWIGELNALYKISAKQIRERSKTPLQNLNAIPHANFKMRVFGMSLDNQQNLYVSTYDGVFKFPKNGKTFEVTWTNPDPFKYVRSVTAISPDSIYWNNLDSHPMQMTGNKITDYYTEEFVGRIVFKKKNKVYALTTSGVAQIANEKITHLVNYDGLANNAVAAIIDDEENIWIGTWEGLLKFRKIFFRQYELKGSEQKEAFSFLEKKNGDLFFGGNRGKIFIKKDAEITLNTSLPPFFHNAEVMCMTETSNGEIWAGSGYQGITRLLNGEIQNWTQKGALKDNNCEALYLRQNGTMLACTEQGVTLISPDADDPMQLHYPFRKKYTRYPELFGCFQTKNSSFWFYGNQGLHVLRNGYLEDDSISNMAIKDLFIHKITEDRKGNIWVATLGKGLLRCSLKEDHLVLEDQYDRKDGLPSDIALSVLVDKNDNVWFGDYMSVTLITQPGQHETITTFNEKDGLISSYYQTLKLEQQKNGTVWGLTSMGVISFHPDSIILNSVAPVLKIDEIAFANSRSTEPITINPKFSFRKNSPEFRFTAVSLTDPSKIRYAYRLKEIDSNWTYSNTRSVNFNFLPAGQYTFEVKACNNNNIWSQALTYHFTIQAPFWQTWWFRGLVLLIIGLLVFMLFRRRINAIKTKTAIRQQMTELEAKALRAQMNPHFIFNCLNAIQELIVTKNFTEAYQYLSHFSKLLRMVLNNSEKNFIPLSSELEVNSLYLQLESLRFKQSFSYEIVVEPQIEEETTYVPSLLLQPFLENAIWHGLMHKEGEKKLTLTFREEGDHLVCIIDDNGIGRERSNEIKAGKIGAIHFESKGMTLSQQRIDMLNHQLEENLSIAIEDKKDEKGNATGTTVRIMIPKQTTFLK